MTTKLEIKPYNLAVSDAALSKACTWWRSLSINEMRALEAKYMPNYPKPLGRRAIHQIWEEVHRNA